MRPLRLSQLVGVFGAELVGGDAEFAAVSTDTRSLVGGELFVALSGPHFDGHAFVDVARSRGAVGALVSRRAACELPQLVVADTLLALGRLGAYNRERFRGPLVGLTGSNGKTTLKEMIAAILRQRGPTLATRGNLNNDIGVPLTLLGLDAQAYAVIEMGANHPGEIAYLTRLARPQVGVVNNAGPCHLEGFGDLDGVARAKGELFEHLPPGATAVINADDAYAAYWRSRCAGRPVLEFGLDQPATVSARVLDAAARRYVLVTPAGEVELTLPLAGRHNLRNACAATAAALAVGATLADVRAGLEGLEGVAGRFQRRAGRHGCVLIDDTYNANPASLGAALETLGTEPGSHWLVLGDMGELGARAAELHAASGAQARRCGFTRLFACGEHSRHAAAAFGAAAVHFTGIEDLIAALDAALADAGGPTVLVKGSRSARMERVVSALAIDNHDPAAGAH